VQHHKGVAPPEGGATVVEYFRLPIVGAAEEFGVGRWQERGRAAGACVGAGEQECEPEERVHREEAVLAAGERILVALDELETRGRTRERRARVRAQHEQLTRLAGGENL
jgi:hypothetical protein